MSSIFLESIGVCELPDSRTGQTIYLFSFSEISHPIRTLWNVQSSSSPPSGRPLSNKVRRLRRESC
jgi:hypothetical protein